MSKVIGFHIICCTYGFWLPNDERGSGSAYVRSDALIKFGPANPYSGRRSIAHKPYDFEMRRKAQASLRYPRVVFSVDQIASVSNGVREEVESFSAAPVYAFASLRDHFHMVAGPCRYDIRRFAGRLKGAATRELCRVGLHPMRKYSNIDGTVPSPWSREPWVIYEFSDQDMARAIKYVNDNVKRAGLPPQSHSFVIPYPTAQTRGAAHHR